MHETTLGGTLVDYLSGEPRQCTTYEDLRQALARFLVEEKKYPRELLTSRYSISFEVNGDKHEREADLAVKNSSGQLQLILLFCPGQVHTYAREAVSMARLALPISSPLVVVTDMRDAELLSARTGEVLARGMAVLPGPDELERLAGENTLSPLSGEQRTKEGRILYAYTGLLKTCCSAVCRLPGD